MQVKFLNSKGGTLVGYLFKPLMKTRSAVIFCHGFTGYKEQFKFWARYFSLRGFITLAFDFTGNGHSDGFFTEGTISQQVSDVNSAVYFLKKNYGVEKVGIVGHSMGATVAMLAASKSSDINCLVVLAPVAELEGKPYKEFANYMADVLDSKGLCDIVDCKRMRSLEMNFFYDIKKHDVLKSIKNIKAPLLVIHGDSDTIIDIKEGKKVYDTARVKEKQFHQLKGVDHYFAKGKFHISKLVLDWCRKHLK